MLGNEHGILRADLNLPGFRRRVSSPFFCPFAFCFSQQGAILLCESRTDSEVRRVLGVLGALREHIFGELRFLLPFFTALGLSGLVVTLLVGIAMRRIVSSQMLGVSWESLVIRQPERSLGATVG